MSQKEVFNHDPVDFPAQKPKMVRWMGSKFWGALAISAAIAARSASAGPGDAEAWIGLPGSDDGFLLDAKTGDVWMTGICLRPLDRAVNTAGVWTTRTAEVVSAGRAMAMLDQTFELVFEGPAVRFAVVNPVRGGRQEFAAEATLSCSADAACRARRAQVLCEE